MTPMNEWARRTGRERLREDHGGFGSGLARRAPPSFVVAFAAGDKTFG
jgi:hypothetical protein